MKYRSRTEIVALILSAANNEEGATKTRLMYKSFLSYTQIIEYLTFLVERELIEYQEGIRNYRTTNKGKRLLHVQNRITELAPLNYICEV